MSTQDLRDKLTFLREQGITGPVEIDGVKFVIPVAASGEAVKEKPRRSPGEVYDLLLFGATEGIPDDEIEVKS